MRISDWSSDVCSSDLVPLYGICLGHQLIGLAIGATTLKMKFGHHGANHPVIDLDSGRVMITSQNHGFAVDESSLPGNVRATHRSLFDGSLQGIELSDAPAFSFQGHRSEEHTSELQSLMRSSYAVFCLKKKTTT